MNRARERASKLAILLFAFVGLVVASGCDLFFPPSRTDAGPGSGVDAREALFPWRLGTVGRGPHRPGTWLTFPVDEVTEVPDRFVLWVIEEDYGVPFQMTRTQLPMRELSAPSDDDAGVAGDDVGVDAGVPSSYELVMPLPIVRAGVFHVAVGDASGPMTRAAEVEVVLRPPPITREEAADAMAVGLAGLGDDLSELFHSEDPEWRALMSEAGATPTIEAFDASLSEVAMLAAISRDAYLELPTDVEPGMRELLWNAGALESLAMRARGVSMLTFGGGLFSAEILRSPVQGILFKLDVLSALLSAVGLVFDVITVVGALVTAPVGGEGCLVGMAAKVVSAFFRAMVDTFMPTDPIEIFELQHSRLVFHSEGTMVAPWARFAPQNQRLGSVFRSLTEVVAVVLSEAVPEPGQAGARALLRRAAEFIVSMVPGFMMDAALDDMPIDIQIALPLDMGFYNVTLSQVLLVNPVLAPLAVSLGVFWDPEVVSPYEVMVDRPGGRATAAYDRRAVGITDVAYTTTAPSEQAGALLFARGFGLGTRGPEAFGAQILQIPFPYPVDARSSYIRVQQNVDPTLRSQALSDEDFIVLDVNLVGGGTTRVLRRSTPTLRVHPLEIDDNAGGRFDQSVVDILVNGMPQFTTQVVPDGTVLRVPLTLRPGVNDVEVVATAGHVIGCGPSSTDPVCLEITFTDADNANRRVHLLGGVGSRRSFRVWTPPIFPTGM